MSIEEDIKVLEEYHIQVIEYKNGFKSVRDINKNENCSGIYIYADEDKYRKRHIDELLDNSISKDTIKEYVGKKTKFIDKLLDEMIDKSTGTINLSYLSVKEQEELINKRNCLLVQKATLQQILEELLEEKR